MKKLYPDADDVSQNVANQAVRIVERHLRRGQVKRAGDLPEEAQVRLLRDVRALFDREMALRDGHPPSDRQRDGLWSHFIKRLDDFLSFSDWSPGVYLPLSFCPSSVYCDGWRLLPVAMFRPSRKARSGG